jgi:predicted aconitase with swiveling domain
MARSSSIAARSLVDGRGSGSLLYSDVGISFWGGVDPASGRVIDTHHPLHGESIAGAVLAIPSGRGSCTGSTVLLELLLAHRAPAAIVLRQPDEILAIGAIVGEEIFGRSLPLVCVGDEGFARLAGANGSRVAVDGDALHIGGGGGGGGAAATAQPAADEEALQLSASDRALLGGEGGKAAQVAMYSIAA